MAIQFKGSDLIGIIPGADELEERELGINTADKKLYSKTPSGVIIEIGGDNINTGLETPGNSSEVHDGHRYVNTSNSSDFLSLGVDATDLTYSSLNTGLPTVGAEAIGSFTAGVNATAVSTAINSFAMGINTKVQGSDSFILGKNSISTTSTGILSLGNDNSTAGVGTVSVGHNLINGAGVNAGGINIGKSNDLSISNDILIGEGLNSTGLATGSTVIGRYNISDANSLNNLFTVGIGAAGSPVNGLSISANGVMSLDALTSFSAISLPKDVLTLGFLSDSGTAGVSQVNGESGAVVLTTGDIAEGPGSVDNGTIGYNWFKDADQTELAQLRTDVNLKEDKLDTPTILGYALVVTDVTVGFEKYSWEPINGSGISLAFTELNDTPNDYTGAADYITKVNSAGDALIFEELIRSSGSLNLNLSTDPTDLTFDLSINGNDWPINTQTQTVLDFKEDLMPGPVTGSINGSQNKYILTVTNPADDLADPGTVTGWNISVVSDAAANVPYDSTQSLLGETDVQKAIDATVVLARANITNIGTLGSLTTAAQDNLVNAINEVNTVATGASINYRTDSVVTTLATRDYSFTDTSSAGFAITLPAGTTSGDTVWILDSTGSFSTNNVTLTPASGETIMGQAANTTFPLTTDNKEYKIIYTGSDWRVI